MLGSNRVSAEVEIAGLDIPEMGLPGYPEFIPQRAPEEVAGHRGRGGQDLRPGAGDQHLDTDERESLGWGSAASIPPSPSFMMTA